MPTETQSRLEAEAAQPLVARLWRALLPLRSVARLMNSGAHPDDETSEMLAVLGYRDGFNLSFACANRGEGGQNDIGTEGGAALGTLRTAEMERAADVLDMRLYWLGQSPDDSITDFGFSKSGTDTMARWGRERVLARFVEIVRTERPDILVPTFLDVPGQHGHHRAMTQAAFEVMKLAADPDYTGSTRPVWSVSKLYLPAWGGGGGSYDDEVPPPEPTVIIDGQGVDPILGVPYARIGQQSRAYHRTQGMGRWVEASDARDWPLALVDTRVGPDMSSIADNLPKRLQDLDPRLAPADAAIDQIFEAFPDAQAMLPLALEALENLKEVELPQEHRHRAELKTVQLSHLVRLCAVPDAHVAASNAYIAPGDRVAVAVTLSPAKTCTVTPEIVVPGGWSVKDGLIGPSQECSASDPYPDSYDPLRPAAPYLALTIHQGAQSAVSCVPFQASPQVLPARRAELDGPKAVLNLEHGDRSIIRHVRAATPGAQLRFDLPKGWRQTWSGDSVQIDAPDGVAEGLYTFPLLQDGALMETAKQLRYPHTAPRVLSSPAALTCRVTSVTLPSAQIGYIGAGNDQTAYWLREIGCYISEIDDATLAGPDPFAGFDTILIGVFAFRFRDGLHALAPALKDWVLGGGTLVTLYHRPWDAWDPATTPPARLEIGQPSLRWRVTDEAAEVTPLAPEHPVLRSPTAISSEDWSGWKKERGLYFAKSWDPAYTPLLSMSDPDEQPLTGGLMSAALGQGRHTHVSLILHHQMAELVPGAYRLMANILHPHS